MLYSVYLDNKQSTSILQNKVFEVCEIQYIICIVHMDNKQSISILQN